MSSRDPGAEAASPPSAPYREAAVVPESPPSAASAPAGPSQAARYRPSALRAMESHQDVERLLPVTSSRSWLIAAAGALLVIAALLLAAATTQPLTVAGSGRAVDGFGVGLMVATVAGQVARFDVELGDEVRAGAVLAHIRSGDRLVPQRTDVSGRVLGALVRPGDPVAVGDWMLEVAPARAGGRLAVVPFAEADAGRLAVGQPAEVTVRGSLVDADEGRTVSGHVDSISPPLRSHDVEVGLALLEPPQGDQVVAVIRLDERVEPGAVVDAVVTTGERNLLRELLGLS